MVQGDASKRVGPADAEHDADDAADHAQGHRLDQELKQDVAAAGADRHADADLARPLGDADEHDVHDADAADEQRDAGDATPADMVMILEVAVAMSAISCWVRTMKSSSCPAADAMALAQQFGDLVVAHRRASLRWPPGR